MITVKQILKSKKVVKIKKNAKKAVLKATLKSSNGKAIKGKKITFKVKVKPTRQKPIRKVLLRLLLKIRLSRNSRQEKLIQSKSLI